MPVYYGIDPPGFTELPEPPDFKINDLEEIREASEKVQRLIDPEIEEIKNNKRRRGMYKRAMLEKLYEARAILKDLNDYIDFCADILKTEAEEKEKTEE